MIPYGRQTIEEDDVRAVVEALRSDWLTQGPKVEEFERALARSGGARFAAAFSSGTTALQAAYAAAGLGPGDEILTTPLTFAATANSALWLGAKAVFADVLPTGNVDPADVERKLTKRTKVLAPVDFAGHPADLDRLLALARSKGARLVEDACHALGAASKGRPVGGVADMTVFSFHPVKSITTGEGGAVLTGDPALHKRLQRFRHHGIAREDFQRPSPGAWYHEMQELGVNGRLTDFQSALGLTQLAKLPRFLARRRELAARYVKLLMGLPLRPVLPSGGDESGWHLFVVLLEGPWASRRDEAFARLREAGIGVQVHYLPVYRHPYYESLGYKAGLCPKAEDFSSRCLSLPLYPGLSDEDQDKVVKSLKELLGS